MNNLLKNVFIVMIALVSTACAETVHTHGHIIKQSQIERLKIGIHSKDDVMRIMGSPSTLGTFNDMRWYYLTETTVHKPLNPNIIRHRNVIIVDFDEVGKIVALGFKDTEDSKIIVQNQRTTPTQGQSLGILDQMINNIGVGM